MKNESRRSLHERTAALIATVCMLAGVAGGEGEERQHMTAFNRHYDNGSIKYRVWIPEGVKPRGIVFASMGKGWDYRRFVDIPHGRIRRRVFTCSTQS